MKEKPKEELYGPEQIRDAMEMSESSEGVWDETVNLLVERARALHEGTTMKEDVKKGNIALFVAPGAIRGAYGGGEVI